MNKVSILIPTYNRDCALAVTLTSLCFQEFRDFEVVISDQTEDKDVMKNPVIQTTIRVLNEHGQKIRVYKNLPRRGMAQQRGFLLSKSRSPYSLFLDDDLILEPWVVKNMVKAIEEEECGFVGQAVIGLSFIEDVRPWEQQIEFWRGKIKQEIVRPQTDNWQRHKLHNAANLYHVQRYLHITPNNQRKYKVAWVGGCVLYDTKKLRSVGGFSFWKKLPEKHCGEDVMAQIKVMEKYGGCGLIPSGVYHQELPTTVPDRTINAPDYLSI